MDAALTLSKLRASMVVGDFDFRNNGAPLTALPAILTALNATYTRNSAKNVVQNGALVSLSANQFGTSYDPVTGLYGYVPEPAATNLATYSDGTTANLTTAVNLSNGTAVPGFTNGIAFGDNSVVRTGYKTVTLSSATAYTISIFVIMDDGTAPVVGTTSSTGDFSLVVNGNLVASAALVRLIGSNVYRVSASYTTVSTDGRIGLLKYITQSARTFRITGIQVETGLRATSYIATTGSTATRAADVLSVPLWINNVKDSQDGSTANWSKANCTCVTSGTAPDGTNTAQLITVTATATTLFYSNDSTKAPSTTVTASVYIKQGNSTTCQLILRNVTTATNFNVGTLTFDTGAIAGSGWSVTNEGNGWFRCTFTQASGITVGDLLRLYVNHCGGTFNAGDTAYFWGAQIEPGSVATAYRPTTSTLESAANANIAGFSSSGYTLFADVRPDVALIASTGILEVHLGSVSDRSLLANSGGTAPYLNIVTGGGTQAAIVGTAFNQLRTKFAGSCAANNALAAARGVALAPDTSVTMPAGLTTLGIGQLFNNTLQLNGFLFRAGLIPQAMTQAQLNGLTT